MEVDEEKLIALVSGHEELYDQFNENYMKQSRKSCIWKEISAEMQIPEGVCREKWKVLRDGFNRSMRRRKTKGAKNWKKWKYEKQMEFLQAHFHRSRRTNLSSDEDSKPSSVTQAVDNVEMEQTSSPATSYKSISERKRTQDEPVSCDTQNYVNFGSHPTPSNSPIHSFFKAMADSVVNFSPALQLRVKNQIFSIVSEAEYEHIAVAEDQKPSSIWINQAGQ